MKTRTISTLIASSAFLFTAAMATGQTPQPQPQPQPQTQPREQRAQQPRTQADPMAEMTLQGCLAQDESRGMTGASKQTAAAQTFVLKHVTVQGDANKPATSRQPGSADQQPRTGQGNYGAQGGQQGQQRTGQSAGAQADRQQHAGMGHDDKSYRVVASQANIDLAKHVGHTVEVKGRVTPAAQPEQRAERGQATTPPQSATSFENEHKTLSVTSLRHISETCAAESDIR